MERCLEVLSPVEQCQEEPSLGVQCQAEHCREERCLEALSQPTQCLAERGLEVSVELRKERWTDYFFGLDSDNSNDEAVRLFTREPMPNKWIPMVMTEMSLKGELG